MKEIEMMKGPKNLEILNIRSNPYRGNMKTLVITKYGTRPLS
jgi:hypothetical protein